jgi:hypothetical protein
LLQRRGLGTAQLTKIVDFGFQAASPYQFPAATRAPKSSIYSASMMPERILIHSQASPHAGKSDTAAINSPLSLKQPVP